MNEANTAEKIKNENFLRNLFRQYYSKVSLTVPNIKEREFGYGIFGRKIYARHISFNNNGEFNNFLRREGPLFVSYSVARYKMPEARPMEKKQMFASDIVYEFDADDLKLECFAKHGDFFCKRCLEATKKEIFKLVEILSNEFSFPEEWMSINFSGNAGYHLHLRSEFISKLSKRAREEILNYLTLHGVDLAKHGFDIESGSLPKLENAYGIKKRLLENLFELFRDNSEETIERLAALTGSRITTVKKLFSKGVINAIRESRIIAATNAEKRFWERIFKLLQERTALPLDRQTSIDVYKLIRVPDTLHGSTGFVAKTIPLEELKEFSPLDSAVVFSERPIKVFIKKAPRFYLMGNSFGPFENTLEELPEYAAAYLIGKGVAQLR
ncbi:MAG: hypothetical protein J7L14_01205 [Candidatus Diapherotrites archaeon]|nr:hypothetical protein [Candidatus Diapherotrites archaeon]